MRGTWLVGLLFLWAMGRLAAQLPERGLQLRFDRQNNFTYATRLSLDHELTQGRYELRLRLDHDNIYNSSRPDNPFVQFILRSDIRQFWRLDEKWAVANWIETDQFLNSGNQRYSFYFGARYRPFEFLELTPMVGYTWDYRLPRPDLGWTPALWARSRYDFGEGLTMETEAFARAKYIQPRHQRNVAFRSSWAKVLGQEAAIAWELSGGSNQMDDYRAGSVEQIKSDTVGGQLNWRYQFTPRWRWESENSMQLSQRRFDYEVLPAETAIFNNLRFGQTEARTRQKISYAGDKLEGYLVYGYDYLGRRYDLTNQLDLSEREFGRLEQREQQKDFFRNQTSLELKLRYQASLRHTLSLTGNNRYLRYDTPSENNFDDHDELNYSLNLDWQARWGKNFSTQYSLIGLVRRYAFLFGERSQDNYTQRNLRLEFSYRWTPLRTLTVTGEQKIYVTYNVKDFEDLNLTDRSSRNLETRLGLTCRPKGRWEYEGSLYRREIHVSYLNWEAFSETTLDTTVNYTVELTATHRLETSWEKAALQLSAGYKHFSVLRYQNTAMTSLTNVLIPINLHSRNHQTGPVTGIDFFRRGGNRVQLSLWWQFQVQNYRFFEIEEFVSLSASFREENLRETTVFFRPFVSLQWNVQLGGN